MSFVDIYFKKDLIHIILFIYFSVVYYISYI